MNHFEKLREVSGHFQFEGKIVRGEPYGCGHINDTYLLCFSCGAEHPARYILQRINTGIFKDPVNLMRNIAGITEYLSEKTAGCGGDPLRETLTIIKTTDGKPFYRNPAGECWRAYLFVEGTLCFQSAVEEPSLLFGAARAFGRFQSLLSRYPAETLFETIPDFHNTAKRCEALEKAVKEDRADRVRRAGQEIEFARKRTGTAGELSEQMRAGLLPVRVTHNDTKLNNVLFDSKTREGICVIDLDTVMPGLTAWDFGDSIRFGASSAPEDEADLSKVHLDLGLFERYAQGYLSCAGASLTEAEIQALPLGAKLMTLECGVRFLTDYLNGDTYFRTAYERHNLVRCRAQFKLVADMEAKMGRMGEIIDASRSG